LQDLQKFTEIGIFCLKIYHLATLESEVAALMAPSLRGHKNMMTLMTGF
jgi:hypothetical protein